MSTTTEQSVEELRAQLDAAKRENEELKKQTKPKTKKPMFTVSEKKCVQINGIRRFPITLYKGEWKKILEHLEELKGFMEERDSELA